MKGSGSIDIDVKKFESEKQNAVSEYENNFGTEENGIEHAWFEPKDMYSGDVELLEASEDAIGIGVDTIIGRMNIWFRPDRSFLAAISKIAVDRVNRAIKVLENGISD